MKKFGIHGPDKGIFIIILCSKWCKSCKSYSYILEKFRDNGYIMYTEINIDEDCDLARELDVHAVPALLFFKNGELINKNIIVNTEILVNNGVLIGNFGEQILKEIINQIVIIS